MLMGTPVGSRAQCRATGLNDAEVREIDLDLPQSGPATAGQDGAHTPTLQRHIMMNKTQLSALRRRPWWAVLLGALITLPLAAQSDGKPVPGDYCIEEGRVDRCTNQALGLATGGPPYAGTPVRQRIDLPGLAIAHGRLRPRIHIWRNRHVPSVGEQAARVLCVFAADAATHGWRRCPVCLSERHRPKASVLRSQPMRSSLTTA